VKPGAKRALKNIDADIVAARGELKGKMEVYQLLGASQRKSMAPGAVPVLKKLVGLFEERAGALTMAGDKGAAADVICEYLGMLSVLGDTEATGRLETMAASAVKADAARGKIGLGLAGWWSHFGKEEQQLAELDKIIAAGKDADGAAAGAANLIVESQNMSHETEKKVRQFGVEHFKAPAFAEMKAEWQAVLAQMALEGKPMKIFGRTAEGKDFDSTKLKGKVIVVDFWASWCGPCKEEMPKTIGLYEKYHAQGLELVGVSSDFADGDLAGYLRANPRMAWEELYVRGGNGGQWHPLTKAFGVRAIPTMFVIDKAGICRSVDGRREAEKLVPQLLAE
jgi:thiol-disulfide isomerase/thioredoxin